VLPLNPDMGEGLVKPFSDVMTHNGGDLFLNTEVLEVIVENDVAKGVVVKDESGVIRDILAERVIVNAYFHDIPKLFKVLPPEVKDPVENYNKIPFKDFTLYAGLGRKITDEAHPVSVVEPSSGSNRLMIWAISNSFPWVAPQGKQLIFASRVLPLDEAAQKIVMEGIKDEIEDIVEEVFPGFKDAIEPRFYASHFPLWHYQHTWLKKIPYRSNSVRNLFFVGDIVEPQNSMCADAAASTGRHCAKSILRLEGR
jgi:phytoene dehydrogenase-like protein